ncbi:MAG: hypothetical protein WD886_07690 [Burkholderiales bacterium]
MKMRTLVMSAALAAPLAALAQSGSYDLKLCSTSEATVIDSAGGGTTKPLKQYPRLSPAVGGACAHATGTYSIRK